MREAKKVNAHASGTFDDDFFGFGRFIYTYARVYIYNIRTRVIMTVKSEMTSLFPHASKNISTVLNNDDAMTLRSSKKKAAVQSAPFLFLLLFFLLLAVRAESEHKKEEDKEDECKCVRKSTCVPQIYPHVFPSQAKELREIAISKNIWTSDRHDFYPTKDVPIQMLGSRAKALAFEEIWETMVGKIERQCGLKGESSSSSSSWYWNLSIEDAFVIRYDGKSEKDSHLRMHQDGKPISFQVSLSDADEYEGGGTNFYEPKRRRTQFEEKSAKERAKTNVKLEKIGDVLVHGGQIDHEGAKVTSGLRYTLVYFLQINKGCCWEDTIDETMNKIMRRITGVLVFLFLLFLFMKPESNNGFLNVSSRSIPHFISKEL